MREIVTNSDDPTSRPISTPTASPRLAHYSIEPSEPTVLFGDDKVDPFARQFGPDRDLPLTFRYRTDPGVIVSLGLPPAKNHRDDDARNAVLTEAKLAYERNRWVSFSRRPAWYVGRARYLGTSYRYNPVLSAVADGVKAGLLEEQRASPRTRGRQSRFRATSLLHTLISEAPVRSHLHEVIWLRDDQRRLVNYADTALTRRMREEIEAVNTIMAEIEVDVTGPDVQSIGSYWIVSGACLLPATPRVRRVFNRSSFDKGGRLYGWWQSLSSADRRYILLNGEPVLEPDYAQIHAQIIYALRGISLIGDAYETGEFSRAWGKKAFNIGVNANNKLGAIAAISKDLQIGRRNASKLLDAVMAKHRQVSDIFCSDAGVGLMKIDADITLSAVQHCQAQGIAVLPVHDSLIVPATDAEQTAEIMKAAFEQRFPQSRTCEVRIKNSLPQDGKDCGKRVSGRLAA
jgi:hypothetical protein